MDNAAATIESLFSRALELPAGSAREAFLAQQGDTKMRGEVRSLLQAHEQAGRFLPSGSIGQTQPPKLPGFRMEGRLGRGSLGIVYAAHDEKLNRPVAIKVLHRRADPEVRNRILSEARHIAALSDPAIVTIYSVLDETDPPAIVMERVEGFPLDRASAELNFGQKARLLREVARGLSVAHEHGILHRDLKPENVMVSPDLRPRILDFGLAVALEHPKEAAKGFEGTPLYASPEQARGEVLTPASDVFSFGSVMFRVLAGRPAYARHTAAAVLEAIATTPPPFLRDAAVGVPEDLQAICLACLAMTPGDRPSARDVAIELGRYLAGEPTRLKPKLYNDMLRRNISEYSHHARAWESQRIISREECDSLEIVHRRLLADEDYWLVDARKITLLQTVLSSGVWLGVVATVLTVGMLRAELGAPWRWFLPASFTLALMVAGQAARRLREPLAAANFLAGAVLTVAPSVLALVAETGLLSSAPEKVVQLFPGTFTNSQVFVASLAALAVSLVAFRNLRMTGFAWTTAILTVSSYLSFLLLFNWLDQKPEVQALWCLPLMLLEFAGLKFERKGRVRWTMPYRAAALVALVGSLDVIAYNGPTLQMLGVTARMSPYFDQDRLRAFSVVLNGFLFLTLTLLTEKSSSLDQRRAGKWLEFLALIHILTALFANALSHRTDPLARVDVACYLSAAVLFLVLAPFHSRWRMLVGGLAGCGFGSYLLVDLNLVARKPFVIGLGLAGLAVALGTFAFMLYRQKLNGSGRSPACQAVAHPSGSGEAPSRARS